MAGKSDEAVREALSIIGKGNENFPNDEWMNPAPAIEVLKRFGPANPNANNKFCSLAVPTWLYGNFIHFNLMFIFLFISIYLLFIYYLFNVYLFMFSFYL